MGISGTSQGTPMLLLPEHLGESLFPGIHMGYQVSLWVWQEAGEVLQIKLLHCFTDLPGSPCTRAQARLLLSACRPPPIAFCFPHSDQGFSLLRGTWNGCPQASIFYLERQTLALSLPHLESVVWDLSSSWVFRERICLGLSGNSAKALKTPPYPDSVLGKLPIEWSVKVSIFSVARMEESLV